MSNQQSSNQEKSNEIKFNQILFSSPGEVEGKVEKTSK